MPSIGIAIPARDEIAFASLTDDAVQEMIVLSETVMIENIAATAARAQMLRTSTRLEMNRSHMTDSRVETAMYGSTFIWAIWKSLIGETSSSSIALVFLSTKMPWSVKPMTMNAGRMIAIGTIKP